MRETSLYQLPLLGLKEIHYVDGVIPKFGSKGPLPIHDVGTL